MKKMFNVFVLLVGLIGALSAFKPNHKNDEVIKLPDNEYAYVFTSDGKKKTIIKPDFNDAYLYYMYKNTGTEDEKFINKTFAFYQETPTAEKYILKIYKYLSEIPGYWYFYDMTEKK